jgi:zinc transport system permease protein
MGLACSFWEISFFIILGWVVSACSRIGGVLLVFCYLVVVPATALLLTRNLAKVLILSACLGIFVTMGGLQLSYQQDFPCNQTIIFISCVLLTAVLFITGMIGKIRKRQRSTG